MNNRTIKFRVWDKTANKMLEWSEFSNEIKDAIPHDTGDEWTENCELMQYTGLKDINGKEIYEGDMLEIQLKNESQCICIVEYAEDEGCFVCATPEVNYALHAEVCFHAKIIGNYFVVNLTEI